MGRAAWFVNLVRQIGVWGAIAIVALMFLVWLTWALWMERRRKARGEELR
jgi:hypothetical protein